MSLETDKHAGTIKFFNETQKYGFILPTAGGKEVFFHISGVNQADKDSIDRNAKDCNCTYELFDGRNGPEATNIEILD